MSEEEIKQKVADVEQTIVAQLRTLGVQFCDEAFNVFKVGGPDEARVIKNIAANLVTILTAERDA